MLHSNFARKAMVVSSHHLASQAGLSILKEGGNAIEAMVAAAATIAVVYPHMNSIGGDGFWLIMPKNAAPICIDACGPSGSLVQREDYLNHKSIPYRGTKAAITMAGTVKGWQEALNISEKLSDKKIPVSRLLQDALFYAEQGAIVTQSQYDATTKFYPDLKDCVGFQNIFARGGQIPNMGEIFKQPQLAQTLKTLSIEGLDSFYQGSIAQKIFADMKKLAMPFTRQDIYNYQAEVKEPLCLQHSLGEFYNFPPPTQGVVSLLILGILDQLHAIGLAPLDKTDSAENIHYIVEATKIAFTIRDQYLTDPKMMQVDVQAFLEKDFLQKQAQKINVYQATKYHKTNEGDTVWLGAIDENGLAVSYIQSIYHEFGSGVVLPNTGILWQNRGASFQLDEHDINVLAPNKKPFHTLNPAAAKLHDGRTMVYGSMGGDGQPQNQAALFLRYCILQKTLQEAVSMPRWLYGRTWGNFSENLKIEGRFAPKIYEKLLKLGHDVEIIADYSEICGHAGAIVRHKNTTIEGAYDPRGNGSAAGF